MSEALTFPCLKPKEIVAFLALLGLPEQMTLDDLKHPTSSKAISVLRTFVKYLMGVSEQELGSQAFFAAEVLADHHMLHEQSVPMLNLWSNLSRLMRVVGINDFTVRDLLVPQPNRFIAHLSALINFTRFRGEQEETAQRLEKETEKLTETRYQLELENQQLRVKEQALRNEREQNQEYRDSLEKELEGLTKKVAEGAGQVNSLHQILVSKKEELHHAVDLIRGNAAKLDGFKHEITRLKSEIVTNPEELIQNVEGKRVETEQKKKIVQETSEKVRELSANFTQWEKIEKKLSKRIRMLLSLEEEIVKSKDTQKEIKEFQTKIKSMEAQLRDLESSSTFAKSQSSKVKTKITRQRAQFEAKEAKVQEALDEARAKKREVMQKCSEDQAKLKPIQALIDEKKEQLHRLQEYHQFNMKLMQARFNQLRRQVVTYHHELQNIVTSNP